MSTVCKGSLSGVRGVVITLGVCGQSCGVITRSSASVGMSALRVGVGALALGDALAQQVVVGVLAGELGVLVDELPAGEIGPVVWLFGQRVMPADLARDALRFLLDVL